CDRNAHGPRCAARRPGGVRGTGRARGLGRRARRHPRRLPAGTRSGEARRGGARPHPVAERLRLGDDRAARGDRPRLPIHSARREWKRRAGGVADAVNKADELDELDDEFEARQKELADQYSDVTEGTTIGVASSFEENSAYLWGSENMLGTILTPLGFDWSAD